MHEPRHAPPGQDQILATVAHELRNPLAPMRHCVSILERTLDDARSRSVVEVMDRQLRQMTRLVDELLEVSRLTRGKIALHKEPVDVGTVIDAAVLSARPVIDAEGHSLTVLKPEPPLRIDGDPERLAQVVSNLLDNAARFTNQGGRILLEARRDGDEAVIAVSDTGVGISADALPGVFDMFSQADARPVRARNGLGLGLTLVRALVELHGGRVTADSLGVGRGSRFEVRLPIGDGAMRERPDATPREEPGAQRILVVDDNRDSADMLATLLQMNGAEVEVAYDGPGALDAIERLPPRAVVLDLGMPGMSGYEVARRIRAQPGLDSLMLIALSGWGQEIDRRRTSEAGFDHHLTKPADIGTVEAVLATLPGS